MANSADPDQLKKPTGLDLHCLQRQGISGFSRAKVKFTRRIARTGTLGRFSAIFHRGDNFYEFLFGFLYTKFLLKRDLKENLIAVPSGVQMESEGSKFFPFREDPFSELLPLKVHWFPLIYCAIVAVTNGVGLFMYVTIRKRANCVLYPT